jgi:SAM-dependent methyltransferase
MAPLAAFQPGFASDQLWLRMLLIEWPISLAPALFTWLLPDLLRYARGGMAWVGLGFALLFTLLLPLQFVLPAWEDVYWGLHPWLFGVFYVYALAGLALCAVGLYDRKLSAVWALLAVLALTGGAVADTVIWFGWATGAPWVPYGFLAFWLLLLVGYLRRPADPPTDQDVRQMAKVAANNRTRRSRSITRKLLREGNIHLLPLYYLIRLSDLGREGIENSGSFRFADHIYRNVPSGRTALGRWLDAKFLAAPATQAFRRRYLRAQEEMRKALEAFRPEVKPLRVLAVPCGIPRDLTELAAALQAANPGLLARLEYHGMDVDPAVLEAARAHTRGCPLLAVEYHNGNALLREDYPPGPFHCAVSTGLGEFLDANQLAVFFRNVYDVLAPGGTFYTSATREEKRGEFIMRLFELITRYRTTGDLEKILRQQPWSRLTLVQDDTGLQTFAVAVK